MRTKLLLLAVVCMAVVVGAEVPGSSADRGRKAGPAAGAAERTADAAVGASIAHPERWLVERERVTLDGTRGYTLWKPESDQADVHDHGATPAIRVALAYELEPRQLGERVREKISEFPDLPVKQRAVTVGKRKVKGTAVGPLPGSTPSWEVYASVDGRVYQVNVYGTEFGAEARKLLSSIAFDPPVRSSSSSAKLPDGDKASSYYPTGNVSEPSKAEKQARVRLAEKQFPRESGGESSRTSAAARAASATAERPIAEGCWQAPSNLGVQVQHGWFANKRANDDYPDNLRVDIPTGRSVLGMPNFWGAYSHGDLGYGRCAHTYYTNDKYAVDYPLNRGDVVFSPFPRGVVRHVGANTSHRDYGVFVVVQYGKYVSMSAHLSSVARGIVPGKTVTAGTVIGRSGDTAYGGIPIGYPHLHQAFYRLPGFTADGSPYGGQGLQVLYHRYTGCPSGQRCGAYRPAGVYKYGLTTTSTQKTKRALISN